MSFHSKYPRIRLRVKKIGGGCHRRNPNSSPSVEAPGSKPDNQILRDYCASPGRFEGVAQGERERERETNIKEDEKGHNRPMD